MPTVEQLRNRLIEKLKELFQLNQPDLDFGFYRIMHARSEQISKFIEEDLLKYVNETFMSGRSEKIEHHKKLYEDKLKEAREFGVTDPDNSPVVKEYREKYLQSQNTLKVESEIYDHLYRFFERYYDKGDFISRRYFTRESKDKAAPFAIPYNGEEVKLHWANADQYYIKTTEYFNNYTFDLRLGVEKVKGSSKKNSSDLLPVHQEELLFYEDDQLPLIVHFQIHAASEGEHGNIKDTTNDKRFFIIYSPKPLDITEEGELIVNFEYRPDPEKTGQEGVWREKRNAEAAETILSSLNRLSNTSPRVPLYINAFQTPVPTEKSKDRVLLNKYIDQYTARNTMDYFIHKDLGTFLNRELDFYLKNEVMHLDDIMLADAPVVEDYLEQLKVIRKIAKKIIAFLAQLENFQKKLWLKKKFVLETNYCITLDRIPKSFYKEIINNEQQLAEWVHLGFLTDTEVQHKKDLEKLPCFPYLILDTCFFESDFTKRLLAEIDDFDEQCNGLLIHSENSQALNLLQERYRGQVKCIYIDPPYNTGSDGFVYKDNYQHSSWSSMLNNALLAGKKLQNNSSSIFTSIDDGEQALLRYLLNYVYEEDNFINNLIWQKKYAPSNDAKWLSDNHDFIIIYAVNKKIWRPGLLERSEKSLALYKNVDNDPRGLWMSDNLSVKTYSVMSDYAITTPSGRVITPPKGSCWRVTRDKFDEMISENRIWFGPDGNNVPRIKRFLSEVKEGVTPLTLWTYSEVGHNQEGKKELITCFSPNTGPSSEELSKTTPKPVKLLSRIINVGNNDKNGYILDYFAGSGTTSIAVINLNREDDGNRKYILVEMENYFDTVMKPRIQKVIFSEKWRDGNPQALNGNKNELIDKSTGGNTYGGISHCFKYMRLESYEDTLNNLRFADDSETALKRRKNLESYPGLREEYMLNYLLDVETQGSQSLLNIDNFSDPRKYSLYCKKPGSDVYEEKSIDLIETFNYLIGLRIQKYGTSDCFDGEFERIPDPELPDETYTRLRVKQFSRKDNGAWWFYYLEGWVPRNPFEPDNGLRERVLIIWRNLTDDLEKDNAILDKWLERLRINVRDFEYDTIYVNCSNNLPNMKLESETWKVRLIEEEFHKRMWSVEDL